tara:strand:- start:7940 stop:8248 length:309 start_codon:yes stop_codon:yes gene_type:complete
MKNSSVGKGWMLIVASLFGAYLTFSDSGRQFEKQDDSWPFTVEAVSVGCDAMGLPYVDAGASGTYGLTGYAVSQGYPGVSAIHVKGKNLGPFIEDALSLCGE